MDKKGYNEYISEKGELYEKIAKPIPKFPVGIMVASGISVNGPGRLVFVTGTMNSFSYKQTLEIFKEDIERLGQNLYFQQDNAPCHVAKKSLEYIRSNFKKVLDFWPPNSPDLSPIEELWSIVEQRLSNYSFNNTDEMARKLQWIWNRIPKSICKNLIKSFDKKIDLLKERKGERVNKRKHNKESKSNYTWKNKWKSNDTIECIVYNEKEVEIMKQKKLKRLNE